ncbi:hypothetical protein IAU60_000831 [Kwoniella sp. DSM 27419]
MPPVPGFSQPLTPAFYRIVVEYIAGLLARGIIDTIPHVRPPSGYDVATLSQAWASLNRTCSSELMSWMRRPRRRPMPDQDMQAVLSNLRNHSFSLQDDPAVDVSLSEIRSRLPDLTTSVKSIIKAPPFQPLEQVDAEVLAMARWFKSTYMRWVDPIPCPICGGSTRGVGGAQSTPVERADGAGRVELHACVDSGCPGQRRFARYGRIKALLRAREGRCGEWAQLFYVFMRAKGIESRYIWNSEDHVWCEYWSPALRHWVHVDPCEAATNKSLLYARGWGKKQACCLAFGPSGAEDVTRAYVDDYDGPCQRRRRAKGWNELELSRALHAHTVSIRLSLDLAEKDRLQSMDNAQRLWMENEEARMREAEVMELGGRVSGPEEWRKMRDEMGLGDAALPMYKVIRTMNINMDDIRLFGDARKQEKGILITSGPSQTSALFLPSTIQSDQDFHCSMTFRLTAPPGAGEADGIAVVFAHSPQLGLGGFGLGYDGVGGEGDFAIEIDTYRTQDHADDPPTPHISLHSPPNAHHQYSIASTKPGQIPFLSDGKVYTLQVFFRAADRTIRGYLNIPDEGIVQVLDVRLAAPQQSAKVSVWHVGFTGSCGGLWQKQEILDWQVQVIALDPASGVNVEEVHLEKDDV